MGQLLDGLLETGQLAGELCDFYSPWEQLCQSLTPRQTVYLDMRMCVLETAIAVIPTMLCKRFTKLQGIIMAALYIAYVFVTVRI